MFRRKINLVKKVSKKLVSSSNQVRTTFSEFLQPEFTENQKTRISRGLKDNSSNKHNENYYRDKLAKLLNGRTEVKIPVGRIDVLTTTQIIEVKQVKQWKSAVGQIIVYGHYYLHHQKRIHLFGVVKASSEIKLIQEECRQQNIIVSWET